MSIPKRFRSPVLLVIPILLATAFLNASNFAGAAPTSSNGVPQAIDHLQGTVDTGFAAVQTSLTNGFHGVQVSLAAGFGQSQTEHGGLATEHVGLAGDHDVQDAALAGLAGDHDVQDGVHSALGADHDFQEGVLAILAADHDAQDALLNEIAARANGLDVSAIGYRGAAYDGAPNSSWAFVTVSVMYKGVPQAASVEWFRPVIGSCYPVVSQTFTHGAGLYSGIVNVTSCDTWTNGTFPITAMVSFNGMLAYATGVIDVPAAFPDTGGADARGDALGSPTMDAPVGMPGATDAGMAPSISTRTDLDALVEGST